MPVTNGEVKVSEPWSPKSRNKGQKQEPTQAAPQNRQTSKNPSKTVKAWTPDGATVSVLSRNKSVSSDKPWDTDGVSLSQKAAPKRRSRGSGGKTMDTFSQNPNGSVSRNPSTPVKVMEGKSNDVSTKRASKRSYGARGANAG